MPDETAEERLLRYETVLDLQVREIDRLRTENERLRTVAGAHGVLKEIYLDPDAPQGTRIKAAQAALNFEKPRLESVPPALDVVSEEIEDLATLVAKRRKRQDELCPQSASDLPPIEVLPIADGRRSNGNGSGNST